MLALIASLTAQSITGMRAVGGSVFGAASTFAERRTARQSRINEARQKSADAGGDPLDQQIAATEAEADYARQPQDPLDGEFKTVDLDICENSLNSNAGRLSDGSS